MILFLMETVWFDTYFMQFQALSGRFAVTLNSNVKFSFRRLNFVLTYCLLQQGHINNLCLSTDLGYGLSGTLMYTWHDPNFGVSVPSYTVNFIMGLCRLSILGQS